MDTSKDTTLARISTLRGLFSTLFVVAVLYGLLITALLSSQWQNDFAQYVVGTSRFKSFYWVPSFFHGWITEGGTARTLASIAVAAINACVLTAVFGAIAFAGLAFFNYSREQVAAARAPTNVALTSDARQIIETPSASLAIFDYSGAAILRPAPEAHLWLRRIPLKPSFALSTPHDHLKLALLEVLEAHAEWTSGPQGHHAGVTIKPHSIRVAQMMLDRAPDDPLAPLIGLSHDLGKIMAYGLEKMPDGQMRWVKTSTTHDHLSAQIVRVLPEFQALPELERRVLIAVLSYAHGRDELPIGKILVPDNVDGDMRIRMLTEHIRVADGLTTRADHASAADEVQNQRAMEALRQSLPEAIMALNINRAIEPTARADGFTSLARGYVAVLEQHLRERLAPLLPEDVQMSLAIRANANPSQPHPALTPILETLRQMGWLIESYRDHTPKPPLFTVRSGSLTLKGTILLKRDAMELVFSDRLARWGDAQYPLRIQP